MDAERIVVDHLNAAKIGATAYYDVPGKRPAAFIVAVRTGGPHYGHVVERPLVDVQCWAKTRRDAAVLAGAAKTALLAMPASVADCFHVSIASTYRDTDLESGAPRYHVVAEITFTTHSA